MLLRLVIELAIILLAPQILKADQVIYPVIVQPPSDNGSDHEIPILVAKVNVCELVTFKGLSGIYAASSVTTSEATL